ncbi:RNA-dependent RNA polymerase [Erysiphe necator associated narnavirus 21]|nr:RNA-dependent RNA polymerase [Erysiphe necator associated narnavirus 21]
MGMILERTMGKRKKLPLILHPVTSKEDCVHSSRKVGVYVPKRRKHSRNDIRNRIWKAIWNGLVSAGFGRKRGAFVFLEWYLRAYHRGPDYIIRTVKNLFFNCRRYALADVRFTKSDFLATTDIPRRLLKWLSIQSPSDLIQFSMSGRSLPECPSNKLRVSDVTKHCESLAFSSPHLFNRTMRESLVDFVRNHVNKKGLPVEDIFKPATEPRFSGKSVYENSSRKGGYAAHICQALDDKRERIARSRSDEASPAISLVTQRLSESLSDVRLDYEHLGLFNKIKENEEVPFHDEFPNPWFHANSRMATAQLLDSVEFRDWHHTEFFPVVHRAACIPERGWKNRIVTVPPSGLVSHGELTRSVLYKSLRKEKRLLGLFEGDPLRHLSEAFPRLKEGHLAISADLSKATDGIHHTVIGAICQGLREAGLPESMCQSYLETLGAGVKQHFVEYNARDLSVKYRNAHPEFYNSRTGRYRVPMDRGSPMGTPLSFFTLCMVNLWAADVFEYAAICGDDLVAFGSPSAYRLYRDRIGSAGCGLNEDKTILSTIGGTFCERFFVCRDEGIGEIPVVSLKSIVGGSSKGSPAGVIDFNFNIYGPNKDERRRAQLITRCASACLRDQIRVAASKGRHRYLPSILGGLGHPCKGVRSLPKGLSAKLFSMIRGDQQGFLDFSRALRRSPLPDRLSAETYDFSKFLIRSFVDMNVMESVDETDPPSEDATRYESSFDEVASYEDSHIIKTFVSQGGRFRNTSNRSLSSILKLSFPEVPIIGAYPARTPMRNVINEFLVRVARDPVRISTMMTMYIRTFQEYTAETPSP